MEEAQSNQNYIALDISAQKQKGSQQVLKNQNQTKKVKKTPLRNDNFDNLDVRAEFILKIYISLAIIQIIILLLVLLEKCTNIQHMLDLNFSIPFDQLLIYIIFFFSFLVHIVIICGGPITRKIPWNFIQVGLHLILFGFFLINLYVYFLQNLWQGYLWQFIGSTQIFILSLAFYSFKTKNNISYKVGSILLCIPTFIVMLILIGVYTKHAPYIFLCAVLIICLGFYLIFYTNLLIEDWKLKLSIHDYILASTLLNAAFLMFIISLIDWIKAILNGKACKKIMKKYRKHQLKNMIKKQRK
ncbi:unnamed protein product [Paramecium primaurelia]|uniref:Transmembrane protein n=1 Tax=Paramecium primaurelia TaxID=5886 RepID=A0A8S1KTD8_PARPR|nr:unnamed protein product [Paramecium primaurelia]